MKIVSMDEIRGLVESMLRLRNKKMLTDSTLQNGMSTIISTQLSNSLQQQKTSDNGDDGILSVSMAVFDFQNKSMLKNAVGMQDPLQNNHLVTADTFYNLGSISKFILMVMTLKLIQLEKIKFSDTIDCYMKDSHLPNANHITVEHLLAHYSGLKDCDFITLTESDPITKLLKYKNNAPELAGAPGELFYYANINYVALAHVIQHIMGVSLQVCFEKLIGNQYQLNDIYVINQHPSAQDHAIGYKPSLDLKYAIDSSSHVMFGATSFRAKPEALARLISLFFNDDLFVRPDLREKIIKSIKDETFEVVTKTDTYRWPTKMGMGIEERSVAVDQNDNEKIYGFGGWQDGNAAFLAYSNVTKIAYCCCVTKTQGMARLYQHRLLEMTQTFNVGQTGQQGVVRVAERGDLLQGLKKN